MCPASSLRSSRIRVRQRDDRVRTSGIVSRAIVAADGSMIVVMVTVVHVVVMVAAMIGTVVAGIGTAEAAAALTTVVSVGVVATGTKPEIGRE